MSRMDTQIRLTTTISSLWVTFLTSRYYLAQPSVPTYVTEIETIPSILALGQAIAHLHHRIGNFGNLPLPPFTIPDIFINLESFVHVVCCAASKWKVNFLP